MSNVKKMAAFFAAYTQKNFAATFESANASATGRFEAMTSRQRMSLMGRYRHNALEES